MNCDFCFIAILAIYTDLFMKKLIPIIIYILIMTVQSYSQNSNLPYYEIPEYSGEYNQYTVAARMVDGLGFRYYWATEGLHEEDMSYQPAEDVRNIRQTLDHIYGLSKTIVNAPQSKLNINSPEELTFEEVRERTLENIQLASRLLKEGKGDEMEEYAIIFGSEGNRTEYPFWNMINGPIADAIYHTGQVVAFRRAAGNPIPSGVRMLTGKKVD